MTDTMSIEESQQIIRNHEKAMLDCLKQEMRRLQREHQLLDSVDLDTMEPSIPTHSYHNTMKYMKDKLSCTQPHIQHDTDFRFGRLYVAGMPKEVCQQIVHAYNINDNNKSTTHSHTMTTRSQKRKRQDYN